MKLRFINRIGATHSARVVLFAQSILFLAIPFLASVVLAAEPAVERPLMVSAATSTKDVVEELTRQFATEQKTTVKVNAGASNTLASQIIAGAPVDLFISANQQWADAVDKKGLALGSRKLLTNKLVLVVPKGNSAKVKEPADLKSDRVKRVALAGEKVPAGIYADQALKHLNLTDDLAREKKIARGQDVRGTLVFVERGEAEAGIVYSTDAAISQKVEVVYEFDPKTHDEIVYVLVLLKGDDSHPQAKKLFDFLQSASAEKIYVKWGFSMLAAESKP